VIQREQAQKAIESLKPVAPQPSPSATPRTWKGPLETNHFVIDLDPKSGAINRLQNKKTSREWAANSNLLGLFSYQTLSQADYDRFFASYIKTTADWAFKDFGKPNIERFLARSQEWLPTLVDLHLEEATAFHRVIATLNINDEDALDSGRAAFPRRIYIELVLPHAEPIIHLNVYCFDKAATRMPEALWLSFNPVAPIEGAWPSTSPSASPSAYLTLDKSGEAISPFEVVDSGNRHMHAVSDGFTYKDGPHTFMVETLDAPVVALGEKTPLLFSNAQPDLSKGIHSNLFNNAWGTNYIMWYGEDMRFRYVVRP